MEQTLLAYSLARPAAIERVEAALRRVADHYREAVSGPVEQLGRAGERSGALVWELAGGGCRWPAFAEEGDLGVVTGYVPTGWERVIGDVPPERGPVALARALSADPAGAAELDPPFLIVAHDGATGELSIRGDAIGVARLYEMRFEEGWVWSNRLGALPLFAGVAPEADERGWSLLAGLGWFAGDATPIKGTRKVRGSTAISARGGERRAERSGAIGGLVRSSSAGSLAGAADAAAEDARALARGVARVWREPPTIHLSGGRDSRVAAAAAVAEGVPARFLTLSEYPGEVAVTRDLLARIDGSHAQSVETFDDPSSSGDLRSRARAVHLIYDGLPNTHILRWPLVPPSPAPTSAVMSGHGGEVAHGFYYSTDRQYRRVRRAGDRPLLKRLERAARRRHSAGRESVYAIVLEHCDGVLAEGRDLGLEGPTLLDYFYLVDRFANWGELGRHSMNCSPFATPGFVRAAFALTPDQRFEDVLHRELIARLAPRWLDVPFFGRERARLPAVVRPWIWETSDARTVAEIVAAPELWADLFRPEQIERMWAEARSGRAAAHYEHIFERLVWRVTFEDHLRLLGARARAQPARV